MAKLNGGGVVDSEINLQIAIVSSKNNFYGRMKFIEEKFKLPRQNIIDGRVFKIPGFDFPRLISEGVAHGLIEVPFFKIKTFKIPLSSKIFTIYPQIYRVKDSDSIITIGRKSYISNSIIDGEGEISVGNFSSVAWEVIFNLGINLDHNYRYVGSYGITHLDWEISRDLLPPSGFCKINIGNDVWIGRGSFFKSNNPEKPLVVGDGAVVASDSVVVKNIPPYAIVGGNPAKIIKYRFSEEIIAALLRIKWWDWDIDKIYENFKYYKDVEKFVSIHDN